MKSVKDVKHDFQQSLGEQVASSLTDEQYALLLVQEVDTVEKLDLVSKAGLHQASLPIGAVAVLMQSLPGEV